MTPAEIERICARTGFSRFPIMRGPDGRFSGYLHIRDVIDIPADQRDEPVPAERIRPLPTVAAGDRPAHRAGPDAADRRAPGRGRRCRPAPAPVDAAAAPRTTDAGADRRVPAQLAARCVGVVMLEDVIEALIGEIRDATRRRRTAGADGDRATASRPRGPSAARRQCQPGSALESAMQRRIMGIETEFGITCTFHGQRRLSPDEVARYLFRRVVSWGRSSNVFLRNGSRLYLDVGSHPEYATAECDDLPTLIAHDKAGERILQDLVVDAEARLAEEGIGGDIYLFKNNTDSAGNSYGCHENFLIARGGEFAKIADGLIPFLVTRQLIAGAGKVLQSPRGASYCLSQRADHIWEGVSSATTRSRPIINTRDEPHADAERYRRLHVIVGDSNMSETTTLLKVGTRRAGAGDDRGGGAAAGLHLREPDPGDPGDLPRHHRPQGRSGWPAAATSRALDAQTDYYEKAADVRRQARHRPGHRPGAGPVAAHPEGGGDRRTSPRWTPRSTGSSRRS